MKGVDTADPIGDIRMLLEKLDDRTVSGTSDRKSMGDGTGCWDGR